jgi:hypothetical protein
MNDQDTITVTKGNLVYKVPILQLQNYINNGWTTGKAEWDRATTAIEIDRLKKLQVECDSSYCDGSCSHSKWGTCELCLFVGNDYCQRGLNRGRRRLVNAIDCKGCKYLKIK